MRVSVINTTTGKIHDTGECDMKLVDGLYLKVGKHLWHVSEVWPEEHATAISSRLTSIAAVERAQQNEIAKQRYAILNERSRLMEGKIK